MDFVESETGKKGKAYVSSFVFKDKRLVAIVSTKVKASKDSALDAKEGLDNFIKLVQGMQKHDKYKDYLIGEGENFVKVKDINVSEIEKITIGPRGSKKFGFDKELNHSEEEIEELYKSFKEIEGK